MKLIQQLATDVAPGSVPKVESWTSGGETVQVITQKERGETEAEWCKAHEDAITAAEALWPRDETD